MILKTLQIFSEVVYRYQWVVGGI